MEKYYPVMLRVENKLCTVIGGGNVAARKINGLLGAGARVRVVAPEISESIIRLLSGGADIEIIKRAYVPSDIKGSFVVIAAADDKDVNGAVLRDAAENGVLAMSADGRGDFINGAVKREGQITMQVSTGVPALSRRICRGVRLDGYDAAAKILAKYRKKLGRGGYEALLSEQAVRLAAEDAEAYERLAESAAADTI